jgi:hypothetical protein
MSRSCGFSILFSLVLIAGCGGGGSGGTPPGPDTAGGEDIAADARRAPAPTFWEDAQPILAASCAPCHTAGSSGGTQFAAVYADNLADASSCPGETVGACSLVRIRNGSMPSGKGCTGDPAADAGTEGCLSAAALEILDAWVDAGMPEGIQPREPSVGICAYVNPFSDGDECKEYTGEAWTLEAAEADCGDVLFGIAGAFTADANCAFPEALGTCVVEDGDGAGYLLVSAGGDPALCGGAQTGCEVFGGGSFVPAETCEGEIGPPPTGGYGDTPFVQPYQVCTDPLPGEAPGQSDGKVCTWTLISGCTEAGRNFADYASCADVRTQRPYYGSPEEADTAPDDPRLTDEDYLAELAWAKSQVQAAACACCHSTALAPDGPSWWYIEAEPIWIDSVRDSGLAMMAGLAGSDALGAFPAADNNGFDRTTLGLPTTDIPRMQAFLLGEWARRGYGPEDGGLFEDFGGPILDQLLYEPGPCEDGEGVAADGTVTWTGGDARYLYVLAADAANPGVPPNLDEPAGTLWLVDVATASDPFPSGVGYGELTGDLRQRIPAEGSPPALAAGGTYYLYVLRDIGFPLARCLFTAPAP